MWRTAILVIIVCCTVHTAPPHHNLLENSDEDVRRLGLLVNELVELIEKGEKAKIKRKVLYDQS